MRGIQTSTGCPKGHKEVISATTAIQQGCDQEAEGKGKTVKSVSVIKTQVNQSKNPAERQEIAKKSTQRGTTSIFATAPDLLLSEAGLPAPPDEPEPVGGGEPAVVVGEPAVVVD